MPSVRRFLLWVAAGAFLLAFLLVRQMEAAGRFDSIGLWYSLLVALIIALPLVVAAAVARLVVQRVRGKR